MQSRLTMPRDALTAKDVDFLEDELAVTVVEGHIQVYDFTPSAESVAKLGSAVATAEAMPVSGGGPAQGTTYIIGVLAVLGLLFAGAASVFVAKRSG